MQGHRSRDVLLGAAIGVIIGGYLTLAGLAGAINRRLLRRLATALTQRIVAPDDPDW